MSLGKNPLQTYSYLGRYSDWRGPIVTRSPSTSCIALVPCANVCGPSCCGFRGCTKGSHDTGVTTNKSYLLLPPRGTLCADKIAYATLQGVGSCIALLHYARQRRSALNLSITLTSSFSLFCYSDNSHHTEVHAAVTSSLSVLWASVATLPTTSTEKVENDRGVFG